MRTILVLLTVIINVSSCFGQIIKTDNIEPIEKLISSDKNTLVIFDNDDIITEPIDLILQSQNRKLLLDLEGKYLFSKDTSDDTYRFYQSLLLKQRKLQLTDDRLAEIIGSLQNKGIKVLLLTNTFTGKYGVIKNFQKYLNNCMLNLGINFQKSWKNLKNHQFSQLPKSHSKTFKSTPAHPLFYKGMIFTCCSNKGKSLEQFLLYAKIHPSKIIFIDDKLKNLVDIEKLCEKEDIPFLGIQYLKDRRLMQADEKTAKFQIEYFKKNKQWLSDTKAHRRLSDI